MSVVDGRVAEEERPKPTSKDMCLLTFAQVQQHWPELERRLRESPDFLKYYTLEWLFEQVVKNHIQVWTIGTDLMVLTQILEMPARKVLQIIWAKGSDLDHYLPLVWEVFHQFARIAGCETLMLFGREGWVRKLRKWPEVEFESVVLTCEVKAERKRTVKGH